MQSSDVEKKPLTAAYFLLVILDIEVVLNFLVSDSWRECFAVLAWQIVFLCPGELGTHVNPRGGAAAAHQHTTIQVISRLSQVDAKKVYDTGKIRHPPQPNEK